MEPGDWDRYVATFHERRAGITEALLGSCTDAAGSGPYEWLAGGLPGGRVLDVGCGSAPTAGFAIRSGEGPPGFWVGIDRSRQELARAAGSGRASTARHGAVVLGDAHALPLAGGSVDGVLSSMSLMVLSDPAVATREAARVLRGGGILHLLLPADRPLPMRDRARYALLLLVLGRTALPFPNPGVLADPALVLRENGFDVLDDVRRCFRHGFAGADDAERFVDSLYVPGVGRWRMSLARFLVRRWAGSRHRSIAVPLRRVTAQVREP